LSLSSLPPPPPSSTLFPYTTLFRSKLDWGTFSAAQFGLDIQGVNVHPAVAKGQMINAIQVGIDFHNQLPEHDRPEHTEGREGFFHLMNFDGTVDSAHMDYIIRDFERD